MAYKIYNSPKDLQKSSLYDFRVENDSAFVHEVRVSAVPFNRHWPGKQRSTDQTEIAALVAFGIDSPVNINVISERKFKKAEIRPSSKNIIPKIEGNKLMFTLKEPGQYTLELDGKKQALHIFADPIKDYGINSDSADTLYFGAGVHEVGHIEMHSGQTLYIDEGAVVYGEIHAIDADNIKIIGNGILDHSKEGCNLDISANNVLVDPPRPSPLVLEYCNNVQIDGIIIRDPCFLAVRPICCENVIINNVKITGCWRYNSDGMDFINSTNCKVTNCFVRTFDDSLCLKGFYFPNQGCMFHNGKTYDTMDNVVYENCIVWNEWGKALEIGVDLCAKEIKNCAFKNCEIIHCDGGVVMDITNIDYARIHNILFENIRAEYDDVIQCPEIQTDDAHVYKENPESSYMPPLFTSFIFFDSIYSHNGTVRGKINGIRLKNIYVTAKQMPVSYITGFNETNNISDVSIDGLYFNGEKVESLSKAKLEPGKFTENISIK